MLPSITILTGTYNSDLGVFRRVLDSIKNQHYPKARIEHLVYDKGSTNGCDGLAKQYGAHVILHRSTLAQAQESVVMGFRRARGDIVLVLESDNIVIGNNWLRLMVAPFMRDSNVVGTFSAWNGFTPEMNAMTRYCALLGSPDPTLYYLHKTEKIRMDQHRYDKGDVIGEFPRYSVVRFTAETLPTLGDNGHMVRTKAMRDILDSTFRFTHTDAFARMISRGFDTYGVVKNSVIHMQPGNALEAARRRILVKSMYYDGRRGRRAYLVYNPAYTKDRINVVLFILAAITWIQPTALAIRGFMHIPDPAWFLHPIMCFLMVMGYGWSEIMFIFRKRRV